MSLLGIKEIKEILPFGYPFLLIDRAEVGENSVKAVKNLTNNEEFFQGHFPGEPIMPGVLQVEAMLQTAGLLLAQKCGCENCIPHMTAMKKVKFRKPVLPGDQLYIEIEGVEFVEKSLTVNAKAYVGDALASQAVLTLDCADGSTISTPTQLLAAPVICDESTPYEPAISGEDIKKVIPHRYPFLLIDRIMAHNTEKQEIIGIKNISINEPLFAGAAEGYNVLPNSLQMEIAAQLGCYFMLIDPENAGKIGYFMAIDEATFYHPVLPGDQLSVSISLAGSRGRFGKGNAKLYVGDKLVTECMLKFAIG